MGVCWVEQKFEAGVNVLTCLPRNQKKASPKSGWECTGVCPDAALAPLFLNPEIMHFNDNTIGARKRDYLGKNSGSDTNLSTWSAPRLLVQ